MIESNPPVQRIKESWRNFSPSEFGNIFACVVAACSAMANWRPRLESARRIGLGISFYGVLIVVTDNTLVVEEYVQFSEMGIGLVCSAGTKIAIGKRRLRLESARRLGPDTTYGVLIVATERRHWWSAKFSIFGHGDRFG